MSRASTWRRYRSDCNVAAVHFCPLFHCTNSVDSVEDVEYWRRRSSSVLREWSDRRLNHQNRPSLLLDQLHRVSSRLFLRLHSKQRHLHRPRSPESVCFTCSALFASGGLRGRWGIFGNSESGRWTSSSSLLRASLIGFLRHDFRSTVVMMPTLLLQRDQPRINSASGEEREIYIEGDGFFRQFDFRLGPFEERHRPEGWQWACRLLFAFVFLTFAFDDEFVRIVVAKELPHAFSMSVSEGIGGERSKVSTRSSSHFRGIGSGTQPVRE